MTLVEDNYVDLLTDVYRVLYSAAEGGPPPPQPTPYLVLAPS